MQPAFASVHKASAPPAAHASENEEHTAYSVRRQTRANSRWLIVSRKETGFFVRAINHKLFPLVRRHDTFIEVQPDEERGVAHRRRRWI